MIGLDTNVVLRYLVRDDDEQTPLADAVFAGLSTREPGFVSLVVAVETWWVLRRSYRIPADRCKATLGALVAARELVVERDDLVVRSLAMAAAGADFADALITLIARDAGCSEVVTFDAGAARSAGTRLLG